MRMLSLRDQQHDATMPPTGKLAVLLQPPGRGDRIAWTLAALGYRVELYRDVESATGCLQRVRAVALLFVDQGERWFAGNDLLSRAAEFRSLRRATVYVTLVNDSSVFAQALRVRGAAILHHPVPISTIVAIARGDRPGDRKSRWRDAMDEFGRLRDRAERLRVQALATVAESRRLRHGVLERRSVGR
jgi:hypothetical protein